MSDQFDAFRLSRVADVALQAADVSLPHGLHATFTESTVEVQPVQKVRVRRWMKNGHLWESCACHECHGRRIGLVRP